MEKQEQLELVKRMYSDIPTAIIAKRIGLSISATYRMAHANGLKKSNKYRSDSSKKNVSSKFIEAQFQKGSIPSNKGKKQTEYMSQEAISRTLGTRFQRGDEPSNHKAVGTERVTKDGYLEVKTEEGINKWKLKHRIVWIEYNGEIPQGFNVQFKDKDRQNCNIDNLYIISRNRQMAQNTIIRYPREIRRIIKLTSKLNKKIKEI